MVDDQIGGLDIDRLGDLDQPIEVALLFAREHGKEVAALEPRSVCDISQGDPLLLGQAMEVLGHEFVQRSALHGAAMLPRAPGEAIDQLEVPAAIAPGLK